MLSLPILSQNQLQENWRLRTEECRASYTSATQKYRWLLEQEPDGCPPSSNGTLALASQAQSDALAEYSRVLRIFTDLTIHGKLPDDMD